MKKRIALVAVLLASVAAGQEAKDGVYLHRELEIRVAVPRDWTLRTKEFKEGWGAGTLVEFANPDGSLRGALVHEEASQKVERYAETVHKSLEGLKGLRALKKVREEKLARTTGTWLLREYEADLEDNDYRRVHVFINRGKHNFHFVQCGPEARWEELKAAATRNIDALVYGEEAAGFADYVNGALNVKLSHPASWARRDKDFQLGDPHAVLEVQRGAEIYGTLGAIDYPGADLEAKAWADASMKAFEKTMENIRTFESPAGGACERRDFRADIGGAPTRLMLVFWPNAEKRKGVYLYFWTAEDAWDGHKDVIERTMATFKTGVPESPK